MSPLFHRKTTAEDVLGTIEAHRKNEQGWSLVQQANLRTGIQRLIDERDVDTLLHMLDISDAFEGDVMLALGCIGDPKAVPVLLNGLQTLKSRDQAVLALAAIGDERAIHPIVETWTQGHLGRYEEALVQLGCTHRRQVLDELISLLKHDEVHIRRGAMYCLRSLRAEEAVSALVEAADDKVTSAGVTDRAMVLQMLHDIGGASAEAALQNLRK